MLKILSTCLLSLMACTAFAEKEHDTQQIERVTPPHQMPIQQQYHAPTAQPYQTQQQYHAPTSQPYQMPYHHDYVAPPHYETPATRSYQVPTSNSSLYTQQPAATHINRSTSHSNLLHTTQSQHLLNTYTTTNLHNSQTLHQSFTQNPHYSTLMHNINSSSQSYNNNYHQLNMNRNTTYQRYGHNQYYHNWYRNWSQFGFLGGFWFPVLPCVDIGNYFDYPMVQWLYNDNAPPLDYYQTYYPQEAAPEPACVEAFPNPRIYFPSDTLRDLLVEASGYPPALRCDFRSAMINFTSELHNQIVDNLEPDQAFAFDANDVVINYYQNLHNQAIVVAGFVVHGDVHVGFEGLLDLGQPQQTAVFVPTGQYPTDEDLQTLNEINNRIISLGGNPNAPQAQPDTTTSSPPSANNTPLQVDDSSEDPADNDY